MPAEAPRRPVNSESLARKMGRREKPYQDMRLNAQRANRPGIAEMLGKKAFVAGEQAYLLSELGRDASPMVDNVGIRVVSDIEFAFRAALGVEHELDGITPAGPPTRFGTPLTDRGFQYVDGDKAPFNHPAVIEKLNIIRDMLGVPSAGIAEDISTAREKQRGIHVSAWSTNMGVDLIEVVEGDNIELYAKRLGPVTDPTDRIARNVRVKSS